MWCVPQSSLQKLMMDSQAVFMEVLRSVDLSRSQALELLQAHERSSSSLVQARSHQIQQEIVLLRRRRDELKTLGSIQDPITFLNVSELFARERIILTQLNICLFKKSKKMTNLKQSCCKSLNIVLSEHD